MEMETNTNMREPLKLFFFIEGFKKQNKKPWDLLARRDL